jgi:signal transduction histidine kinase
MRRKPRSIRSKIILALLVPVVALIGLWTLDLSVSVSDAAALQDSYHTRDNLSLPVDQMVTALQAERTASVETLAAGQDIAALSDERLATDVKITEFRRLSKLYRGSGISADIARSRIADMGTAFDALAQLRMKVNAADISGAEVVSGYAGVIGYAFTVSTAAATSSSPFVERIIRTGVGLRRAGELLHQEDALLTGVTTASRFGAGESRQLIEVVGALRFQIPTAGSTLPGPDQAGYKDMLRSPAFSALRAVEDQLLRAGTSGDPVPTTRDVWKATFTPAIREFYAFLANGYDRAAAFAEEEQDRIIVRFVISGVLGMLAIVMSLLLAIHIGRSVVRRLTVLRTAATDLAQRLPGTVQRLRTGERVDVDGTTLRLSLGDDEIAEVGFALSEVQRSAIDSAAGEAALRYDLNRVLVNIARRNQTLIDRQLEALNSGDRATARAAQLAAQMRRHADHLVILAGSARSRRGLGPETLAGIITRVAGEVEHAERIEIGTMAEAEVPEPAVTDIGHLLAELLENGTTFSPPGTPVRVSARPATDGIVVEIEDHGLGMSASALEETNQRLTQPQEFDPGTSNRLGLFVVGLLAAQRGIRVVLRPSGDRGITATVHIPAELAVPLSPAAPGSSPGRPGVTVSKLAGMATSAGRGTGSRHAAEDRV